MNKKLNRYIPLLQFAGAANALASGWGAFNRFAATLFNVSIPVDATLGVIIFAVLSIYALGCAGGILLWKNLRLGAALSVAHWLLMMPSLAVQQAIAYDLDNIFYSDLVFGLGETSMYSFNWGAALGRMTFIVGPEVNQTAVGVDFVAIAVLIYLASHWNDLDLSPV